MKDNQTTQIDITGAEKGFKYAIFPVHGDCLNSNQSNMRVEDGEYILVHEISLKDEAAILGCIGKLVCIVLTDGRIALKEAVCYDGANRFIRVKMYKPQEMYFKIPVEAINTLYVADKVLSKEYIEAHTISAK